MAQNSYYIINTLQRIMTKMLAIRTPLVVACLIISTYEGRHVCNRLKGRLTNRKIFVITIIVSNRRNIISFAVVVISGLYCHHYYSYHWSNQQHHSRYHYYVYHYYYQYCYHYCNQLYCSHH